MKLIIVRHGETVFNAADKVQSLQHNSPFTPRGLQQIQAVAKKIKKIPSIDVVYTSCLSRCIETVEKAIADKGEVPIVPEQLLQQRNWGALAGMTRSEIGAKYPESGYDDRGKTVDKNKKFIFRPPGGENWLDVQIRLRKFIDNTLQTFNHDETIIIFTHLAISRSLLSILRNEDIWSMEKLLKYSNINVFDIVPDTTPNTFCIKDERTWYCPRPRIFNHYTIQEN
jgi:broad specificity phosphatase PhoE